jgi:hypothetical protein
MRPIPQANSIEFKDNWSGEKVHDQRTLLNIFLTIHMSGILEMLKDGGSLAQSFENNLPMRQGIGRNGNG